LTVQTEEGISEQKQNKESKEALEKQAPVVNLKDQDKKVVSKTPETKTTSKNQTETEETKTKEMEESTDKNSFLNNANKAPKDNQLTPVTSKSGPRTVKNSQRLTDFWWLIPLVIVLGAGLWWIKKKRRPY
jgi:uncharacterized membrane protein YfhO